MVTQILRKFSIQHITAYMQVHVGNFLNALFEKKCQRRIRNKNFSIVCSTCIGGVIYHRLGMQFLSPTINLWFYQNEFIKFIQHLPEYLSQDLKFISTEWDFPVALLGDVRVLFNHASNEEDAKNAWNKRKNRIQYENLYIILYDRDGISKEDIKALKNIQCKRLLVLSEREYPDIDYVKTIRKPKKARANDCVFLDHDSLGFRTFEKQFDFVAWLNGEDKY